MTRALCFTSLVIAVLIVGCSITTQEAKRIDAPRSLECPAEQLTYQPFAGETEIVKGCGKEELVTCVRNLYGGSSCFVMQNLPARAVFDLDCDKASIELTPLSTDGQTVGVRGCNRKATYQYVQVSQTKMDWVPTANAKQEATPR